MLSTRAVSLTLVLSLVVHAETVGTAHPVRVLAAAADASWAVLCEARADTDGDGKLAVTPGFNGLYGDEMVPVLVLGSGPGTLIEDFVAADPTGRYLVLLRKGALVLLDTTTRAEVVLKDAYAGPTTDPSGAHVSVTFDAAGQRLSFVSLSKGKVGVTVRELATGTDTALDPGPGTLVSAALTPSGRWVELLVELPNDSAGSSSERPASPLGRCTTRVVSDVVSLVQEQPRERRLAPATGGAAVATPGFLTELGDGVLRREADGAVVLVDPRGKHQLMSAACKGVIDGEDLPGRRVVGHCSSKRAPAPWLLLGAALKKDLGKRAPSSSEDTFTPFGRHLFWTTNDADDTTLDVETGKARVAPHHQRVLAVFGARTLISRHQRLLLLDGAQERDLGELETEYPEVLGDGPMRYVKPWVVDLASGTVKGRAPVKSIPPGGLLVNKVTARVFAVARDGRLLGTFNPSPTDFPVGPLSWLTPDAP